MSWNDYLIMDQVAKHATPEFRKRLKDELIRVNISDLTSDVIDSLMNEKLTNSNLVPPYEHMWFEWAESGKMGAGAAYLRTSPVHKVPRKVTELTHPDLYWVLSLMYYSPEGSEHTTQMVVGLDRSGNYLQGRAILTGDQETYTQEEIRWNTAYAVWVRGLVTTALSLMNCKNVSLIKHHRDPLPRGKKSKKPPIPRLSYHTIKLPGVTYDSSGKANMTKDEMAYHLVRGHFKTYTAERPLLGKATGTYWWAPQARGNKDNGEVVKDYEVSNEH